MLRHMQQGLFQYRPVIRHVRITLCHPPATISTTATHTLSLPAICIQPRHSSAPPKQAHATTAQTPPSTTDLRNVASFALSCPASPAPSASLLLTELLEKTRRSTNEYGAAGCRVCAVNTCGAALPCVLDVPLAAIVADSKRAHARPRPRLREMQAIVWC